MENFLKDKSSKQRIFYKNIMKLLYIKRQNKAFHPNAKRVNLSLGKKIFGFKRISLDKKQTILVITNLSSKYQKINIDNNFKYFKNLLAQSKISRNFTLQPFETLWLSN